MPRASIERRVRVRLLVALCVLGVLLGGCGFAPRGADFGLSTMPGPLRLAGIGAYTDLGREIVRQLRLAGAGVVSDDSAVSVLRIEDVGRDTRVLAVDSRNRVVEYELEESLRFSLLARNGETLVPAQGLRALRIQFRPENAVLGSNNEADLLRADMRRELAQRLVQRLARQQ